MSYYRGRFNGSEGHSLLDCGKGCTCGLLAMLCLILAIANVLVAKGSIP